MSLRNIASLLTAVLLALAVNTAGAAQPGEAVMAWHVTLSPTWFDPSTAPPQITPFGMLYALHDAMVRPLPGSKMAPSLAESWRESPDGLTYEFKLRPGLKFHNGDPVTTDDVKFSYERYRGAGAKELQARVKQVDVVDPLTIRFQLKEPWPDFMTFYGTTATAAGLVVPEEIPHAGRRRRLSQEPDRRRPVQVREPHARRRGRAGRVSGLLAARSVRQAPGHEERHRRDHPRGDAEDGRGGHLLRPRRPRRREREARPARADRGLAARLDQLARVRGSVGSEVALERPAAAAGGQPRDQPQGDQRRRLSRLLPARGGHRAAGDGVRAPGRAAGLRSGEGQTAPGGRRVPERNRRGRSRPDPAVLHDGRGGRELSQRGRDPRDDAPDGARNLLYGLARAEAPSAVHHGCRQLGQRREPGAGVHLLQGDLCLRRLPGHRRPVRAAGAGARHRAGAKRCSTRSSSSRSTG